MTQGFNSTPVAVNTATDTVIKASAGVLRRVVVTTVAANPMSIFDNATTHTGTIVGQLAASAALGPYDFDVSCKNGITIQGSATNPAVTVIWD